MRICPVFPIHSGGQVNKKSRIKDFSWSKFKETRPIEANAGPNIPKPSVYLRWSNNNIRMGKLLLNPVV
jgi:hypothetical protein